MDRENFDRDDLKPKVFKFKYRGADYEAREASAGAALRYKSASLQGAELTFNDKDKSRTMKRLQALALVENLLVGDCVFEDPCTKKEPNGADSPVGQGVVEQWDHKITKRLYTWIRKHSDLQEKGDLKSLRRERDDLDERIKELEEEERLEAEGNDPGKGSPVSTTGT